MSKLLTRFLRGSMMWGAVLLVFNTPANAQQPVPEHATIVNETFRLPVGNARYHVLHERHDPAPARFIAPEAGMPMSLHNGPVEFGVIAYRSSNLLSWRWQAFDGVEGRDCQVAGARLHFEFGL